MQNAHAIFMLVYATIFILQAKWDKKSVSHQVLVQSQELYSSQCLQVQ